MPTILEALYKTVELVPDDIALTLENHHVSYAQLKEKIERMRFRLSLIGINQDARVVLLLPNIIDTVVLLFACNANGASIIMMHPLSSSEQIHKRCVKTQATHGFFLDALHHRYQMTSGIPWYVVKLSDQIFDWKKVLLALRYCFVKGRRLPKSKHSLTSPSEYKQEDAILLFSSGTSENQKIIRLSNESFIALSKQMESCVEPTLHSDSMLCALPFFHGFGLGISLLTTLFLGGRAILVPRITNETIADVILQQKPTYIAGVPFLYRILLKDKKFITSDLYFIKNAFIGGELVPTNLIQAFNTVLARQHSSASLQVGYGTTETLTAVTLMPINSCIANAVGYPFVGNDIKILKDEHIFATADEVGEILIFGPTLMNGYILNNNNDDSVWFNHQNKRYYRTNDLGYLDENGLLYFVSRKDELIKSRGYFVNPTEIEQLLYSIKGISEVKVFNDAQEKLSVMIKYEEDLDLESIKKQTNHKLQHLDDWSIPRRYLLVNDIPKNAMKKMNKSALLQALNQGEIELLEEWFL